MVFDKLGFKNLKLRINDRRILESLSKTAGLENFVEFAIIIDKLDKIGLDEVIKLLKDKGANDDSINNIKNLFSLSESPKDKIQKVIGSFESNLFDELSSLSLIHI